MFVHHLNLVDWRCYATADVELGPGVTIFVGQNGQGKTNLVEAVEYLSSMSSHRVSSEAPLVKAGQPQAIVRGRVQAASDDVRQLLLEIEVNPGKANRARINRNALTRAREICGVLRTVVFSPEDLAIVKGDPSDRRRFLDQIVITRWPRMAGVKADYEKALKQRNTLLKSLARPGGRPDEYALATLDVWDAQLARIGSELLHARLDTITDLMPHVREAYESIAPTNNIARAEYKTSLDITPGVAEESGRVFLEGRLRDAMLERRREELARGVSLVGPHRDDLTLYIGELPAKGYASHGECWSLALALRLGSFQLLRADGIEPVLVLDDVFAELDSTRRLRLAEHVRDAEQVLVTAAVATDVPELLILDDQGRPTGRRYRVRSGTVVLAGVDGEPLDALVDDAPGPADPQPGQGEGPVNQLTPQPVDKSVDEAVDDATASGEDG
ncbi:DNA replication/repair protein RecF [Luteococcus japonicus]|uniref:DNA replication and repair protein RecF n=1 Tax=Luteococcus japonicus LSP_Lj1 TaxID=1255658 RepID=A0A1R4J7R4_9ACTN|nr:DNA recombination and repair protein RecF [Luteococcus japonicus LSP_Lj1]